MINKKHFQNIISKYYLDGLSESVKLSIINDVMSVDFISNNKDLAGTVIGQNTAIKNSDLYILDTNKLNKLLSILDDDLWIEPVKEGKICTKLIISDKKFELQYSLASPLLISKTPKITEPEYDIEYTLSEKDITSFIKATSALQESDNISILPYDIIVGGKALEILFGNNDKHSNKISYITSELDKSTDVTFKVNYRSELIRPIMANNKNATKAKLSLSLNGLLKLEFEEDNIKSTYFLIQKEE